MSLVIKLIIPIFSYLVRFRDLCGHDYFKTILCVAQKCHNHHHLEIRDFCKFKCSSKQIIFGGEETCANYCKWLFNPQHRGYTAIFLHNGGCFDILFVLGYMYDNLIYPKIVTRASMMTFHECERLDSLNFMNTKLADRLHVRNQGNLTCSCRPNSGGIKENQSSSEWMFRKLWFMNLTIY